MILILSELEYIKTWLCISITYSISLLYSATCILTLCTLYMDVLYKLYMYKLCIADNMDYTLRMLCKFNKHDSL